jgi:hypothetical protein
LQAESVRELASIEDLSEAERSSRLVLAIVAAEGVAGAVFCCGGINGLRFTNEETEAGGS